jgi:hypothetical protein
VGTGVGVEAPAFILPMPASSIQHASSIEHRAFRIWHRQGPSLREPRRQRVDPTRSSCLAAEWLQPHDGALVQRGLHKMYDSYDSPAKVLLHHQNIPRHRCRTRNQRTMRNRLLGALEVVACHETRWRRAVVLRSPPRSRGRTSFRVFLSLFLSLSCGTSHRTIVLSSHTSGTTTPLTTTNEIRPNTSHHHMRYCASVRSLSCALLSHPLMHEQERMPD